MELALDNIAHRALYPVIEMLGVHLLDQPEATKFLLGVVVISVVILVRAHEPATRNFVSCFSFDNAVNREGELRLPGLSGQLVVDIKLCRWRIFERDFLAHVVLVARHDMRLLTVHQIDKPEWSPGVFFEIA